MKTVFASLNPKNPRDLHSSLHVRNEDATLIFFHWAERLLHGGSYRAMSGMLKRVAAEVCDGRMVMIHEGGYSTAYVPFCALAVMEELTGVRTEDEDPFEAFFQEIDGQELLPHQKAVIDQAALLAAKLS